MIYILLVIVLVLLCGAAFLSASETAITAASKAKIHQMAKSGHKGAILTKELQKNLGLSLSAILLCNTLFITFATSTVTDILTSLVGKEGIIYAPILTSILIVIYAETLPKILAVNQPEKVLIAVIYPISYIFRIFKPITRGINHCARAHLAFFGFKVKGSEELVALEELRGVIDMHFSSVAASSDQMNERAMLKSILELRSVHVAEIMMHRKNVTMLSLNSSPEDILNQVVASPFTRLPLWEHDTDNIVGVIHAKALLRAVQAQGGVQKLDIRTIMTKPWFIPENTDLIDQLQAFRQRREHFALVVDEYGDFQGIVTLEDILEEIVGDISDEHDVTIRGIRPQADGSYIVDGTVTIRDINRQLDWQLPDEEAATVAGLVLYEVRKIPEVGQSFHIHNYRFTILRRHGNQMTLLKIQHFPPTTDQEGSSHEIEHTTSTRA